MRGATTFMSLLSSQFWRCKARHTESEDTLATSKHGRWYHVIGHITGKKHMMTQEAKEQDKASFGRFITMH